MFSMHACYHCSIQIQLPVVDKISLVLFGGGSQQTLRPLTRVLLRRNNGKIRIVRFMGFREDAENGRVRIRDKEEGNVLGRKTKERASSCRCQ